MSCISGQRHSRTRCACRSGYPRWRLDITVHTSTKDIRIRVYPLSRAFPNLYGFGGSDPRVSVDGRPLLETYQKVYGFERIRVSMEGSLNSCACANYFTSVNQAFENRM